MSVKEPTLPEALRSPAAKAAGAALSPVNLAHLRFVEANPQSLEPTQFAALVARGELAPYPLQPWPTFITREVAQAAGELNFRLSELVKSLPRRIFGNDPARLASYYRLEPRYAALLVQLLTRRHHLDGLVGRGDFILTASGFQCIELNMGGNLGGWKAPVWAEMYRRVPLFERFVREAGVSWVHRNPPRRFFVHLVEQAQRARHLEEGVFRVAFLVARDHRSGSESLRYAGAELEAALAESAPGITGETVVCENAELGASPGGLLLDGRRVHAVVEQTFERVGGQTIRVLLAGGVDVYNGPLTDLFFDKRNLALLSEQQDSSHFDDEERALIAAHIPWTREVHAGLTTAWDGSSAPLPELLLEHRERLVLKPAGGTQGKGVLVGRRVAPELWKAAVAAALASDEPMVVQERVDSRPYLYLDPQRGCCEHDLVWGFFSFGRIYGGGFLRMMPKEGSPGVVNAAQGATEGVLMEVEGCGLLSEGHEREDEEPLDEPAEAGEEDEP